MGGTSRPAGEQGSRVAEFVFTGMSLFPDENTYPVLRMAAAGTLAFATPGG